MSGVRAAPNLLDNVLSKLSFQELRDLVFRDQIKTITVFKVFLKEQMLHFVLVLYTTHIFFCQLDDVGS